MSDNKIYTLNKGINVFIFIFMGMTIISGVQTYRYEDKRSKSVNSKTLPFFNYRNNIVWILLDEYASPASLQSQFNFHTSLVDSLNSKGFFVYNALKSRSDLTIYSINSLFNQDDRGPVSNSMYAADNLYNSSWIKQLKKNGYEFVSLDFFNVGGVPKLSYLRTYPDVYIDQVLCGSVIPVVLDEICEKGLPYDEYNQKAIKKFKVEIHKKRAKPTFIWVHLLIPHNPFYRDAKGKLNKNVINIGKASRQEIVKQYTDYLSYGNTVTLKMLEEIPDWKDKTIIISGDHGARMLLPDNDPRRKETFGAIYYPGMDRKELDTIKYMQQIPFHLH
ncbi:sulfatase-like hydrolase/transferase [Pedobacter cryoconitis]|uniref:Sulfatase N-terminal domain-containing protein n=1 Tax=Pedobacter cryoconitis TaxID=188932 RepID=A0A7X0J1R3_9SPHI|nr:sulfatase-like hydrolase/transferase [Pedobacter cryoconitis]MBB6498056.1 hypothetical protein [Pedobacter cryoconitis]